MDFSIYLCAIHCIIIFGRWREYIKIIVSCPLKLINREEVVE